ncbi:hypothetical protein Tco_0834175 [Tanacetum coccineum]
MKTKDYLSSCSDSEEQEIQLLQIQAKILKENSMNKYNALKTTIQHLLNHDFPMTFTFKRSFQRIFGEDERTFKFVLDNNMKNLETQLNKGTLQKKDSKSTIRIQECKVQEVKASDASSRDKDSSGIVSDKGNDQSLENQSSTYGNDSKPMAEDDQNVDNHEDERVVLASLTANLKVDIDENKKIQKKLRNANTSLTHELKECKSTLEETNRTLRESNRTRDTYLGALHDKEVELEKYKIFKNHTIEKDTLERRLK